MNADDRTLSYFGLARRAGKLVCGDVAVMKVIRNQQAHLVVFSANASSLAKKKYTDKCTFYNVQYVQKFDSHELGKSIGKVQRVVLAITDPAMSKLIVQSMTNISEVEHP